MTDFMAGFRADIARLDPITRAAVMGARADAIEQRQEEERRAALRDQREAELVTAEAIERQQIATRGYSDAELARAQAEREGARLAEIETLEARLDQLDPRRRAARAAETRRMSSLAQMDATLARARELRDDPVIRRAQIAYHERAAATRRAARQAEIARLERLTGREIVR